MNHFNIDTYPHFKMLALHWAEQHFEVFVLTENNQISYPEGGFENYLACGISEEVALEKGKIFEGLEKNIQKGKYYFGWIGYDVKNEIESLTSQHPDKINFEESYFFSPKHLLCFKENNTVEILSETPEIIFQEILQTSPKELAIKEKSAIKAATSKQTYCQTIEKIKQHILEGDVYELNYCINFFAENTILSPVRLFEALNKRSPMPFAVFLKKKDKYLICASPERFLKKIANRLISQPIKGTIKRGETIEEDVILKYRLRNSEKEIAENMMITDLVRNDLAKSATIGSVKVEELFGIYTFAQVHQLITTVTATLNPFVSGIEAIKNAFPMGSMTGAPKIKAMQLIDQYETNRRGLYSGTVGYFTPNQDFDFNVVIRAIQYNATKKYICFDVGSAITYDAIAEQEYEECLLKAKAIREVLNERA